MMQKLIVSVILIGVSFYLIRHFYLLFAKKNEACQGCGLAPKSIQNDAI